MRILLSRTDALGDLIISLPVQARILARDPGAEVHWLVGPHAAPLLAHLPGVAGVHVREKGQDLVALMRGLAPDAVLNLGHRDAEVIVAARRAGVPLRVARARRLAQILAATHRIWAGRHGTGRHESQNVLEFLHPFGWQGGVPPLPRLVVTEAEVRQAEAELALNADGAPRLGVVLRGSGAGAFPSREWWDRCLPVLREAGWRPVLLAPVEASELPPTDLRGLMGRLAACHAVVGPSTGPLHMAAALDRGVLCLMGRRVHHGPDRWAPLGRRVQVLQYPGAEDDLGQGMDRLDPRDLLPHLEALR